MAESKIPYTITYRKPGTAPPIFVAGSFSNPEWQPKEMDHSIDSDGEQTFRAQVMVEPGKDYQFKIRIGDGDWWVLAENYAVATDDSGNQNNLLTVTEPSPKSRSGNSELNGSSVKGNENTPSSSASRPQVVVSTNEDNKDDEIDLKTPLFAHECFGAYEFVDTDSDDHDVFEKESPRRDSRPLSKGYDVVDIDVNDPTIEKFPSDRGSILDALRTIQTHLNEDQTHVDIPSSPRVISARRTSVDSIDESNDHLSLGPLSPTASRRRDSRLSHSSVGRSRSAVSLGSIAEEPKPGTEADQKPRRISPSSPRARASFRIKRPLSEEDEAVAMTASEVTSNDNTDKGSLSQIQSNDSLHSLNDEFLLDSDAADENGPSLSAMEFSRTEAENPPKRLDSEPAEGPASKGVPSSSSDPAVSDRRSKGSPEKQTRATSTLENLIRSLFNIVFGSKLNMGVATGAAALAIGYGWWKGMNKQVVEARMV
ncbi:Fc.00g111790.m01.CDS01 [Cosmosporella sp. VM-42]